MQSLAYAPRYIACYALIMAAVPILVIGAVCMVALALIGKLMVWTVE